MVWGPWCYYLVVAGRTIGFRAFALCACHAFRPTYRVFLPGGAGGVGIDALRIDDDAVSSTRLTGVTEFIDSVAFRFRGFLPLCSLVGGFALPLAGIADAHLSETYGKLPLQFEANQGQAPKD